MYVRGSEKSQARRKNSQRNVVIVISILFPLFLSLFEGGWVENSSADKVQFHVPTLLPEVPIKVGTMQP